MKISRLKLAFLLVGVSAAQALAQTTGHQHEWGYEGELGPAHWGALKAEYATCSAGKVQSPIDIRSSVDVQLPAITFDYKASPLKIVNNGHTTQVIYAAASYISVGTRRYELKQIHFHHPSEERIQGKSFDMVAHLVHADSEGQLAVVAVLLNRGSANGTIQSVWDSLPPSQGEPHEINGTSVNAAGLLPSDRAYFTFPGSLTTPPCTEGVTWFVLQTPTEISGQQIDAFAKIFPNNARPIQPIGDRQVRNSQ